MTSILLLICQLSVASGQCSAIDHHAPRTMHRAPQTPNKFAVIIGGVGGEPVYEQRFADWTDAMYKLLRDELDFAESHMFYLTATPTSSVTATTVKATAAAVHSTFETLKTMAGPESLVFVFLVGHGSFDGQQAKFNLVGRDLTAEDFGRLLDGLPTQNLVVVNTTSASGPFIQALSQPGRVIITATRSGMERHATRFAESFIEAFRDGKADLDKNGRVSMHEAFAYAAETTARWYQQQGQLATEHALLDDNGDRVGHAAGADGDGALARTVYLDSRSLARATGDPELQTLIKQKEQLERSIEALKARQAEMTEAAYQTELERLLIKLARINQKIKARQK